MGARQFKHYINNKEFFAVTDCRALAHFNTTQEVEAKMERWVTEIEQMDLRFIHRPGKKMAIPDGESRDPRFENEKDNSMEVKKDITTNTTVEQMLTEEYGRSNFKLTKAPLGTTTKISEIKTMKEHLNMKWSDEIVKAQEKNEFCKRVKEWKTKGTLPNYKTKGEELQFIELSQ